MKQNNKAVEKGIEYQNKIKEIILNTIIKKYNLSPQERAERVYADINYYIRKIEQITAEETAKRLETINKNQLDSALEWARQEEREHTAKEIFKDIQPPVEEERYVSRKQLIFKIGELKRKYLGDADNGTQ